VIGNGARAESRVLTLINGFGSTTPISVYTAGCRDELDGDGRGRSGAGHQQRGDR
jgi:hypothetical protein